MKVIITIGNYFVIIENYKILPKFIDDRWITTLNVKSFCVFEYVLIVFICYIYSMC